MNDINDLSLISPDEFEEEVQKRKAEAETRNQQLPIPPLPSERQKIPDFQPLPPYPTPPPVSVPNTPPFQQQNPTHFTDLTQLKTTLNQIWVNTVLQFVLMAMVGITAAFVLVDVVLYQLTLVFFVLVAVGIGWWRVNSNLSPKHIQ